MSAFQSATNKLRGHRGPVTCFEIAVGQKDLVLSGSEDKSVRLWDIRTLRTSKCMTGCFSDTVEALKYGVDPNLVYAASGCSVFLFDLRFEGVICKDSRAEVSCGETGDDINSIAINSKGDLLAVAMDNGLINLIPLQPKGIFCENSGSTRYKRLSRVHTNIVNCINFKRNNPRELLSGGFDCIGCVWEVDRGRPKVSIKFQQLERTDGGEDDAAALGSNNPMQIVNPPFVMSMNYICDGRCVVAALGDGTVRILNSKDLSGNIAIEEHNCMISAMYSDNQHIITGGQ